MPQGSQFPHLSFSMWNSLTPCGREMRLEEHGMVWVKKGWIDRELFHGWLVEHFLKHDVASRPLLLLLDGHSSHYEPATIKFAKENDVIILCLPPHTTHETQPLDCSLFRPLKIHWREAVHDFYQKNPGKVISKLIFSGIFRQAWLQSITAENTCGGFQKAGVYPFNRNAISLCDSELPASTSTSAGASSIVSAPLPPPQLGYLQKCYVTHNLGKYVKFFQGAGRLLQTKVQQRVWFDGSRILALVGNLSPWNHTHWQVQSLPF